MSRWMDGFIGLILGGFTVCLISLMVGVMLLLVSGCSRHYEREKPRSQMCQDLGKWDCK